MPTLDIDGVWFDFAGAPVLARYDEWGFYRNQVNSISGAKAVDLLAIFGRTAVYLIEVKDYRRDPVTRERRSRTKPSDLAEEMAEKVLHTLGGLLAARTQARDMGEQHAANLACQAGRLRVVLHLEQSPGSRLFPQVVNPADLQIRLRQLVKAVDPHASVVSLRNMGQLPWATR